MKRANDFNIPVLFVVFNRLETSMKSFEAIRQIKPEKLYIACDGARPSKIGEIKVVEDVRKAVLDMIDWDCKVQTLFQSKNLGCGAAVFAAIDWLFDNEDMGIIIEDDCLTNNSFFKFCDQLLEKYQADTRIGMIAGHNPIENPCSSDSYVFSNYKACWGWATWKRAWTNMDFNMNWKTSDYSNSIIDNNGIYLRDSQYWEGRLNLIEKNHVNAWDWQWYLSLAGQNQLTIFPVLNLVDNIGFGENATHTTFGYNQHIRSNELRFPLKHPVYVCPNSTFEKRFYKKRHSLYNSISMLIPHGVKRKIKNLLLKL